MQAASQAADASLSVEEVVLPDEPAAAAWKQILSFGAFGTETAEIHETLISHLVALVDRD